MLAALSALLVLQLAGEAVVRGLGLPVPGPVLGLVFMLVALRLWPGAQARVLPAAQPLLAHLSLLFVPAGTGVMLHLQRLGDEALAIGVALVLSTWVGMAVTAWTVVALLRRQPPTTRRP
jgi:holin-like protein